MIRKLHLLFLVALPLSCGDAAAPSSGSSAGLSPPADLRVDDDPPRARRALIAELAQARDAERNPADGAGTAKLLEPASGEVIAGGRGSFVIEYTAGPLGIAPGGLIQLIPSPFWGWSAPQTKSPPAAGYTTVESPDGAAFDVFAGSWLEIRLGSGGLPAGERVIIRYGTEGGRAFVDRYAEEGARLWIGVDGNGDGVRGMLDASPSVNVVPGPPARLVAHLPATAKVGEPVTLRIAALDRLGNTNVRTDGVLQVTWGQEREELQVDARGLAEWTRTPTIGGVHRAQIELTLADGLVLEARSNPMLLEVAGATVLWGDLHGHSQLSDGTGTVDAFYAYARDVAALDVVALTDHDHWGMQPLDGQEALVRSIRATADSYNEPGRFVALFGYEWTNWIHGHRHVLEFGDELPVLSSLDTNFDDPAKLWAALEGKDVLTLAHHSAGDPIPTNWDFAPPRSIEPITEIASVHGSSEAPDGPFVLQRPLTGNFVRDALDRGYNLGFVGSGDSHDGHPGLPHLANANGGGLAGIIAKGRTKADVLEALRARRCFATNGPRMIVRAALGGAPMGSDVAPSAETVPLYLRAIGTDELESLEIIRKGHPTLTLVLDDGLLEFEGTFDIDDLQAGEYVYLRVHQKGLGTAWTSPFFVR